MYGILGEDNSDVETLKVIVRRLKNDDAIPIKVKGYEGCGQLLRKGMSKLISFRELGCKLFIICYDSDGDDAKDRRRAIEDKIVNPTGFAELCCIVIPVQELEAWLLADLVAVTNVCTGWRPNPINNPEHIASPKEYLEKLSRDSKKRPRFSHAVHNEKLAKYIDLKIVHRKCPSFRPLQDFVLCARAQQ